MGDFFLASDDHHHHKLLIEMDEAERIELSRAGQREVARSQAIAEMARKGMKPYRTTHPHAERVQEGLWLVEGWWMPDPDFEG